MKFASTRSPHTSVDLKTALLRGLAPDGGLYLPDTIPMISAATQQQWSHFEFSVLASHLAQTWFGDTVDTLTLQKICAEAYDFAVPSRELRPKQFCAELFHGPSLSFKDFAAQFLMRLLDHILIHHNERLLILTATSGDTGSAVAAACHGRARIQAVILYPQGRISRIQEQQIATWGGNVHAISVPGNFDDCQRLVKARLAQPAPAGLHLSSANSINIGRLLPQTFYYWYLALQHPNAVMVVPSGNIGNLTAGVLAQRMGAPIHHFVAATNANDALPRFLQTGTYTPHATVHTVSNAMDVGDPSNFERLNHLFRNSVEALRKQVSAVVISDAATRTTMSEVWQHHHYLMDPHTAVAWTALTQVQPQFKSRACIALSTAHPAKFPELVIDATGQTPPVPPSLQAQLSRPHHATPLSEATDAALNSALKTIIR